MGKHEKRQRKRPKKSKRYLNEDHILRLYANAADGETSLLKTMDPGSKRPRNAMKSDHRQRVDANAADGETSLSKTMGLGSKRPRNARKSSNDSNVFADGDSSEEEPVFNLGGDNTNDSESGSSDDDDDDIDEDIQPDRFSAKRLGKKVAADNDDDESSEDDFYKEVKRQRTEKLNAKAALYTRTPRIPVAPQPLGTDEDGRPARRPITEEMWKNKGLTRYRKKRNNKKNRLKKYKMKQIRKHKAMMARRAAPYGGEPGGIDPNLIRSIRLNRSG